MELVRLTLALGLLIAQLVNCVATAIADCPKQCVCVRPRLPLSPDQLKLRCGGDKSKVSSVSELQFAGISQKISQLDLSNNEIGIIGENTFQDLTALQKLDLSQNKLHLIEKEAFKDLVHLKRLYLSSNKIQSIHKATFKGLSKVERLKLNLNLISTITEGAFDELVSLKQLDISGNPLSCDCEMVWVVEWARERGVKLSPPPRCASPAHLAAEPLRKLTLGSELQCRDRESPPDALQMQPANSQVVFEGDSLKLHCRATLPASATAISASAGSASAGSASVGAVAWSWEDRAAAAVFADVDVTAAFSPEQRLVDSWLNIDRLADNHTGTWCCHLAVPAGNLTRRVAVIVISQHTRYCPQEGSADSKGVWLWPRTVWGFPAELACAGGFAQRLCSRQGRWLDVNATQCPYVSETTKILEQFAKMNLTLSKATLLESAKRLKNFTGDGRQLTDKMDVVFAARTLEKYCKVAGAGATGAGAERELATLLVETAGAVMQAPGSALAAAQREDNACSRLLAALQAAAEGSAALVSHGPNVAMQDFRVRRETFSGQACTWYSRVSGEARLLHCSNSNASIEASSKVMEASVQLPASLFRQLESQGISTTALRHLTVTMFANARFFPSPDPPLGTSQLLVTSAVVGIRLAGLEAGNLTEPLYVVLRAGDGDGRWSAGPPLPARWDGLRWTHDGCTSSYFHDGLLVFQCNRLGYFALTRAVLDPADAEHGAMPAASCSPHPTVLLGSAVLAGCLLSATAAYAAAGAAVAMPRRARHAAANTWAAVGLLAVALAVGVRRTGHAPACRALGLAMHYLTLSALLWMCAAVGGAYKRLARRPREPTQSGEPPRGEKPLLGLYLIGWGIGLIVCGISAAVNVREYAGPSRCFLPAGPAASAVLAPAALLLTYLSALCLLTRCAAAHAPDGRLSETTQPTEHVDLSLLGDAAAAAGDDAAGSEAAASTAAPSSRGDAERPPLAQLRAHVAVLALFALAWAAAALSVVAPFGFRGEAAAFGALYAAAATALGGFVVAFYCLGRRDVRAALADRCRRRRRVSDAGAAVLPLPMAPLPSAPPLPARVAVGSRASVESAPRTEKSASARSTAAAAANAVPGGGLIAAQRRQCRSERSVTTAAGTDASGPSGAEFYDPRQSTTARKFFRKQRRRQRQQQLGARRRGDGGGADSDGGVAGRGHAPALPGRLVLAAETGREPPPVADADSGDGETVLAELAAEFKAIREEMRLGGAAAEGSGPFGEERDGFLLESLVNPGYGSPDAPLIPRQKPPIISVNPRQDPLHAPLHARCSSPESLPNSNPGQDPLDSSVNLDSPDTLAKHGRCLFDSPANPRHSPPCSPVNLRHSPLCSPANPRHGTPESPVNSVARPASINRLSVNDSHSVPVFAETSSLGSNSESRISESGASESRISESGASELRLCESGASESRISESGASESRLCESGASESRFSESGASESRLWESRESGSAGGSESTDSDWAERLADARDCVVGGGRKPGSCPLAPANDASLTRLSNGRTAALVDKSSGDLLWQPDTNDNQPDSVANKKETSV